MPSATGPKPDSSSRNNPATNNQNQQQQSTSAASSTPNNATTPTNGPPKVNKPSDSQFKQQKLKAWQPILTAGTVLPTFFIIGLIFIPIGVVLFITSEKVQEYVFDYTDECKSVDDPDISCKEMIRNRTLATDEVCQCDIRITIKADIAAPVYIYYGLTNFYQNHRRYVKSRDDTQLLGVYDSTVPDCQPFQYYGAKPNQIPIYPCGAVANSLFNDTFVIHREIVNSNGVKSGVPVDILYTDIAWPSDRSKKFKNPSSWDDVANKTVKPLYWREPIYKFSENEDENGVRNESFIVWMRTAALPTFRKLHSRVNHGNQLYKDNLPAGNYTIRIGYNYPVDSFDGRKRFIISNTSWAGGKNPFLGVAYTVVGSLCILTGFIFLLIHMKFGKSLSELASVS